MNTTISLNPGVEEVLPPDFTQTIIIRSIFQNEDGKLSCEVMHIKPTEVWETKHVGDQWLVNNKTYTILSIHPKSDHKDAQVIIQLKMDSSE